MGGYSATTELTDVAAFAWTVIGAVQDTVTAKPSAPLTAMLAAADARVSQPTVLDGAV